MISARARDRMVRELLEKQGIDDPRVLAVMRDTPRHLFVDEALASRAYGDENLPIGDGQTLSQPYTVARMSQALMLDGREEILEIGTGSGYQTAILAKLCHKVYTIERLPALADSARKRLRRLGYHNVICRQGDGSIGWPEERRFDRVIITAGTPVTPDGVIRQLAPFGLLVAPEGTLTAQTLVRIRREADGSLHRETLEPCCFVPLLGAQGWKDTHA
ncbi:MAG: protein-L-isoaspartate(D-aspartate) O-methyltransferase [Magnetococcales bacterium]|nr:protein-L-isoaspartate(D-aspartate) O-methyltransferase [Magnetococcales bacterium]MBF0262870.1 protein-L-isoaspartate(D-aspartate) O-methyltransferase [Magnetococcales bacterium]